MITDPIANIFNQIKLATKIKKKSVVIFSSKIIVKILQIMKDEGFIIDFLTKTNEKNISKTTVYLKYKDGVSVIFGIKRVSKPSFRVMKKAKNIPYVMNGLGTAILTTNKGVMCEKTARKLNVGGELIGFIW